MSKQQWLIFFLLLLLALLVLYRNNKLSVNPLLKTIIQTMFSKPGVSKQTNGN